MLTYNLNGLSKARIWFESNDKLSIDGKNMSTSHNFRSEPARKYLDRTIIIELFLPYGARIVYGGLGVDYKHIPVDNLLVNIPVTKFDKKVFDDSQIALIEQAHVGLPINYYKEILLELTKLHQLKQLTLNGELNFSYAIHSEVSSNNWIFRKLTYFLIWMLTNTNLALDKESLVQVLNQNLKV